MMRVRSVTRSDAVFIIYLADLSRHPLPGVPRRTRGGPVCDLIAPSCGGGPPVRGLGHRVFSARWCAGIFPCAICWPMASLRRRVAALVARHGAGPVRP